MQIHAKQKQPSLELKTRPKQLLGYLPLAYSLNNGMAIPIPGWPSLAFPCSKCSKSFYVPDLRMFLIS